MRLRSDASTARGSRQARFLHELRADSWDRHSRRKSGGRTASDASSPSGSAMEFDLACLASLACYRDQGAKEIP
jgi:hypothetical protein